MSKGCQLSRGFSEWYFLSMTTTERVSHERAHEVMKVGLLCFIEVLATSQGATLFQTKMLHHCQTRHPKLCILQIPDRSAIIKASHPHHSALTYYPLCCNQLWKICLLNKRDLIIDIIIEALGALRNYTQLYHREQRVNSSAMQMERKKGGFY